MDLQRKLTHAFVHELTFGHIHNRIGTRWLAIDGICDGLETDQKQHYIHDIDKCDCKNRDYSIDNRF